MNPNDSDDDDVLYSSTSFDQDRTLIGGEAKNLDDIMNSPRHRMKKTFGLCAAFLGLGLAVAVLGPTLHSLKHQVNAESMSAMAIVFSGRGLGYLGGTVIGGVFFDLWNPQVLIAVSLGMASIGLLVAAFSRTLPLLIVLMSTVGVAMGVLDTGANVVCIKMWGRRSSAFLQMLHFAFAVGACLSPLLATPFIRSDLQDNACGNISHLASKVTTHPPTLTTHHPTAHLSTTKTPAPENSPPTLVNCTPLNVTTPADGSTATLTYDLPTCVDAKNASVKNVTCIPSSGSHLEATYTNVTCVCTDSGGLNATCSFGVTLLTVDLDPPVISNCPADIVRTVELGTTDLVVTWTLPTATDFGGDVTVTQSHQPGDRFPAGQVTNVTYIFSDPSGNVDTCIFTVNVMTTPSNSPPTLVNCPTPFNVTAPLGHSTATLNYSVPTCVDEEDGPINATCTPSSGSDLQDLTLTNVSCVCTDNGGLNGTCSFGVTLQTGPTNLRNTSDSESGHRARRDPCDPNPCLNEGTCDSTDGTCTCAEGSIGKICDTEDPCNPNPCLNEGTCDSTDGSCTCAEGFTGKTCKTKDPCNPNPCLNDGKCKPTDGSCTCADGFAGVTCDTEDDTQNGFHGIYILIAVYMGAVSLLFCYFTYLSPITSAATHTVKKSSERSSFEVKILCLLFVFYLLYVGGEISTGGYIADYYRSMPFGSACHASLAASWFWATFALGRGLAICLAAVATPWTMVVMDLAGGVLSTAILVYFNDSAAWFWLGTAMLGLSIASLFPAGIAWLEGYVDVSGRVASVLVTGAVLGEMIIPLLVGNLMFRSGGQGGTPSENDTASNPEWLMYIMCMVCVFSSGLFAYAFFLANELGLKSANSKQNSVGEVFDGLSDAFKMKDVDKKPPKQLKRPIILGKKHKI